MKRIADSVCIHPFDSGSAAFCGLCGGKLKWECSNQLCRHANNIRSRFCTACGRKKDAK